MYKSKVIHLQGIKVPELTHQRIQELKQTKKGQLIMKVAVASFPELLRFMTDTLNEQISRYEQLKQQGENIDSRKLMLITLLDDYLFLEFAHHVMFLKWREEKAGQAVLN